MLTKGFFALPLLLLILSYIIFKSSAIKNYKPVLISLGIPILISGAYYARNLSLYKTLQPVFKFRILDNSFFAKMSFTDYLLKTNFSQKFIISFWSNFGWIKPRFTGIYYRILTAVVILALIGLVIYLVGLLRRKEVFRFKFISLLIFSITSLAAFLFKSGTSPLHA